MKKRNRCLEKLLLIIVLLALSSMPLAAASPAGTSSFDAENNGRLFIIRSADSPSYLAVEQSFRAQLSQYFSPLLSQATSPLIRVQSFSLGEPDKVDQLFLRNNLKVNDIIVTIGTGAAHNVLNRAPVSAVLSVFIPRDTYYSIMGEVSRNLDTSIKRERAALFLDQPDERLVLLAKLVVGEKAKVSLLRGAHSSEDANFGLTKVRRCGGKSVLQLMSDVNIYHQAMTARILKRTLRRSDIIIATPELVKKSPGSIKWMLYMAYQRNIPVVGYSQAFVDAGALAAVYSAPKNIGRQAAEMYLHFKKNKVKGKHKLQASMYPRYFQVSVNQSVAGALGYTSLVTQGLKNTLLKSDLNCKENVIPAPSNEVKQQLTRR